MPEEILCDAAFQGGGVRGIGYVGAVQRMEQAGYRWLNLAGTSAGSILAALLAVGYSGDDLHRIMTNTHHDDSGLSEIRVPDRLLFTGMKLQDEGYLEQFGLPGKAASLALEYGVYEGQWFLDWLNFWLGVKGKTTFGDLKYTADDCPHPLYRLRVVAVDLTDRRMVVFPTDIRSHFGLDPDTFSIAAAVRMSMSIPVFYEPYRLTDARQRVHLMVDGGMLSTYPIWLLDKAADRQQRPLFGFKLYDELRLEPEHDDYPASGEETGTVPAAHFSQDNPAEEIGSLGDYLMAMVSIMLDSFDKYGVQYQMGDHERTVEIPSTIIMDGKPKKIGTTYFSITETECEALRQNGYRAAEKFLAKWDYAAWESRHRGSRG